MKLPGAEERLSEFTRKPPSSFLNGKEPPSFPARDEGVSLLRPHRTAGKRERSLRRHEMCCSSTNPRTNTMASVFLLSQDADVETQKMHRISVSIFATKKQKAAEFITPTAWLFFIVFPQVFMDRGNPYNQSFCRPLPNPLHNSGTEHSHRRPSSQAYPTCKSCPTCSFEPCHEETNTSHWDSPVGHSQGKAPCGKAFGHKSGTAREWHPHCIQACPYDTKDPSSKESLARSQRSRWMTGIPHLHSYLLHKICIPSVCHQLNIPTFPACSSAPNKTCVSVFSYKFTRNKSLIVDVYNYGHLYNV